MIALPLAGITGQVVVTAQATAQAVDEVSKAVSVVGSREIEERDEATLTDALRSVPGLRIQQLGGPGRLVSIKSRGLRNQDTAVLVDGLRFRDATTGDATSFLATSRSLIWTALRFFAALVLRFMERTRLVGSSTS